MNSNRYFVDCIDVFDKPLPGSRAETAPGHGYSAHQEELLCTLFLFNDRLIVAKRESAEGTGRSLAGLDNINKLVKEMQMPDPALSRSKSPRKNKAKSMRYRGEFDLGELVAKDDDEIGRGDVALNLRQTTKRPLNISGFSLFLERPPKEFTDRWNGRPVRKYQILKPETPADKQRFLNNIWNCIALSKGEKNHSTVRLWSNGTLSAYWNIYDKRSYLAERRKAKIALQIMWGKDEPTELAFGMPGPHVVSQAYFQADGGCEYVHLLPIRDRRIPDDRLLHVRHRLAIRGADTDPRYTHLSFSKLVGLILQTGKRCPLRC